MSSLQPNTKNPYLMDVISFLPIDCISLIISQTSPRDACRSSVLSPALKSAADDDSVWENFLPSDCLKIISGSVLSSAVLIILPKKELYLELCRTPVLVADGTMSFALDKETGKKCYMISARALSIAWSNTHSYWKWKSIPESRFSEVAVLNFVWWLDVKGSIYTSLLSLNTTYTAYFVFKLDSRRTHGFKARAVELCVSIEGGSDNHGMHKEYLDPTADKNKLKPGLAIERGDGWMEIEMGDFTAAHGNDEMVTCTLREVDNFITKHGLIVEGIELRPKTTI